MGNLERNLREDLEQLEYLGLFPETQLKLVK